MSVRWCLSVGAALLAVLPVHARVAAQSPDEQWPFWTAYAQHFISADGRVMDPDRNSMTTSEGQSYAMFFALVANDRPTFERLHQWSEANLAQGQLAEHLPAWSWGNGRALDPHSAADADLWIAYDLIEAGALWGDAGYAAEGRAMLREIAQTEVADVPKYGPVLLPGAGFQPDANHWILNPSYMPEPLFLAAAHADAAGPWQQMARTLPTLLRDASPSGFAMDWVEYAGDGSFTPVGGPGNDPKPEQGSYDAIRVYLWAGIDSAQDPAHAALLKIFTPMRNLLRAHPLPPETVTPAGQAAGVGSLGFSAALVPFLWAYPDALLAGEQQRRMQEGFDRKTNLLGAPPRYYDQNLALFATAWQEKRFRFAGNGSLRVLWKR